MSNDLYTNLSWLPHPPEEFLASCRFLSLAGEDLGRRLRALASYSLDSNQLSRLANVVTRARRAGNDFQPLMPFRLGILSNSTVDLIVPALIATALRYGIALEVITGGYNQALQEALSPDSAVNQANTDAVLVAIDYRGLPLLSSPGEAEAAQKCVEAALKYLETIRSRLRSYGKATCIFQTLASPPETLFGSLDGILPGSLSRIVSHVNLGLAQILFGTQDVILDIAHLAATVGLAAWHSPRDWDLGKIPFSDTFLPLYADHLCRVIAALRGKSRRCLILDLDNTVWGGVIGDDHLEGIQVAQGDATGEAYRGVQRLALDLRKRGVVLAVCSKNEDEIARLPFRSHPDMLLRDSHISVFQANWRDKPTNICAIAEELSLGLDSMVLLDDNPAERALVRQALPEVAVPELPSDPALYARTLAAAGYFEAVLVSREDATRADSYRDNARRVALLKQFGDLEGYLKSLDMEITFRPFDQSGRQRITQLINKSNQFNLTTRRYTEAEVADFERDPRCFTMQVRLSDTFGDNGMISVIICQQNLPGEWDIDTWLMSCRVLGRRVENMVLKNILDHAKKRGIHKLRGVYVPTGRNKLVEEHYLKLGFTQVRKDDKTRTYELEVDCASVTEAPMKARCCCCESH